MGRGARRQMYTPVTNSICCFLIALSILCRLQSGGSLHAWIKCHCPSMMLSCYSSS